MGVKRPFDHEEFQELQLKHARLVDYCNKFNQFEASIPSSDRSGKYDGSCDHESTFLNFQNHEKFEDKGASFISNVPKAFEINAPLSLVTSSSKDEDIYSVASYSSPTAEYFDFPWRNFVSAEDSYPPRKQVPVGPNHQAILPEWSGHTGKGRLEQEELFNPYDSFSILGRSGDRISNNDEAKLMGSCVIQMPDIVLAPLDSVETGCGRRDCNCPDEGSVRCVRQHIIEAREELRGNIGNETFLDLGFMEMGEIVAREWSEEEQRVFHKVVYSNPVSFGQNFWEHLSQVFPGRSTKEIVSYYFNVFMLGRRAAQNRSHVMDIDSDDDELPGIKRTPCNIGVSEDEDSDVESPVHQYDNQASRTDYTLAEDDEDEYDSGSDNDNDRGGDCATEEESGIDDVSNAFAVKSFAASRHEPMAKFVDKNVEGNEDEFTVHDDSCTSFELPTDKFDSCGQIGSVRCDVPIISTGKADGCDDGSGQLFLGDSCDRKAWDDHYVNPINGVDQLPPTCNIIEEIFGQGSSDEEARNE